MSEEIARNGLPEEEFNAIMQSIGAAAPLAGAFLRPPAATQDADIEDSSAKREALLCALKPYLSPERCAAIDYLLRLWRVGEAIAALGGTHVHPTDV